MGVLVKEVMEVKDNKAKSALRLQGKLRIVKLPTIGH
jgi:hypothetical protein